MKKLLLVIAVLFAANAFAYKVEIKNNTSFDVTVFPQFPAKIVKNDREVIWRVKAGETLKKETGGLCAQALKIEAVLYAAQKGEVSATVMPEKKIIEYKPKPTDLDVICGDYSVTLSTYQTNAGTLEITAKGGNEIKTDEVKRQQ